MGRVRVSAPAPPPFSLVMSGPCAGPLLPLPSALILVPAIGSVPSAWILSQWSAYRLGSTRDSHGESAWWQNIAIPSPQNSGGSSDTLLIGSPGIGHANESTPQYTPVFWSNSPRVVGESHTGGCTAVRSRSPIENVSPSLTQRQRSSGNSNALLWRSSIAQLHTSVAFGHAVSTSSRLPVWSTSSCERYTHFTSAGSTRLKTSSRNCLRFAIVPVSRINGSSPLITIEFR